MGRKHVLLLIAALQAGEAGFPALAHAQPDSEMRSAAGRQGSQESLTGAEIEALFTGKTVVQRNLHQPQARQYTEFFAPGGTIYRVMQGSVASYPVRYQSDRLCYPQFGTCYRIRRNVGEMRPGVLYIVSDVGGTDVGEVTNLVAGDYQQAQRFVQTGKQPDPPRTGAGSASPKTRQWMGGVFRDMIENPDRALIAWCKQREYRPSRCANVD